MFSIYSDFQSYEVLLEKNSIFTKRKSNEDNFEKSELEFECLADNSVHFLISAVCIWAHQSWEQIGDPHRIAEHFGKMDSMGHVHLPSSESE